MASTVASLHDQGAGVSVVCATCRRTRVLDLEALVEAGKGDVELEEAWQAGRFRCGACGGHRVTLHVAPGPVAAGPAVAVSPSLGPLTTSTAGKSAARSYARELALRQTAAHRQGKDLAVSRPVADGKQLKWEVRLLSEGEAAPPGWTVYLTGSWHWPGHARPRRA